MINDLIDTATNRCGIACEQTRRMQGIVTRNANAWDNSMQRLVLLVDSLSRIESAGVINMQAARQALTQANSLLGSGALGVDVAKAARGLGHISNSLILLTTLGKRITQGVTGISGGDPLSIINGVGSGINGAVTETTGIFDIVQRAFDAAFNPNMQNPLANVETTALQLDDLLNGFGAGLPGAGASHAHLLVLTTSSGEGFYFNLSTAGFDTLRRQTNYNVAAQERLTRTNALQAVSKGGETITLSGVIFTKQSGSGQLDRLRRIGYEMLPVNLISGYGETFGQWYLVRIEEEQGYLFSDGMPRKQQFTLEFQRYGEDYQNI